LNFNYSRQNLQEKEKRLERAFEVIPGLTSWSVIAGMVVLSFVNPVFAAVLIIAFDLYWIMRLIYMNIFLVLSYFRLSSESKTDWMGLIAGLDRLKTDLSREEPLPGKAALGEKFAKSIHLREYKYIADNRVSLPKSADIMHLVIIPIAKEDKEIVEPGIKSLKSGSFPSAKMLVVMALEGSAPQKVKEQVYGLQQEYRQNFFDLLVAEHPQGLAGEARVKGANSTYAARLAAGYLSKKQIAFENVIVSCFDADTVVNPGYFSCLTYYYMITPFRERTSFQPIPVYNNNIWEAPGFSRVLDVGSSFFQLIEATNPEQLVTFSSHSMSFKALVDIDYWPVDMISDDSAIFWKAFIHFDGDYRAVPMFTTVSLDVTVAGNWWRTLVNVYRQKRRWAWGVENFPIIMRGFLKADKIPLSKKLRHSYKIFEGHISWATWPFILGVIGWLPAVFSGRQFTSTALYYNAPRITATIFKLASLGLLTCIILSLLLLPKKKIKHNMLNRIGHAFEWLFIPLASVILSALPALDAQTRLMFGRYMEFWVTEKQRKH